MTALHKTVVAAACIALLGCADQPQTLDADLARDIALASEVQQQSVLVPQDTALSVEPEKRGATSPRTEVRTPTKTAPAPATTAARPPAPRIEQPVRSAEPEPDAAPPPAPAPSRTRGILAGTSFGLTTRGQV